MNNLCRSRRTESQRYVVTITCTNGNAAIRKTAYQPRFQKNDCTDKGLCRCVNTPRGRGWYKSTYPSIRIWHLSRALFIIGTYASNIPVIIVINSVAAIT